MSPAGVPHGLCASRPRQGSCTLNPSALRFALRLGSRLYL